MSSPTWGLRIPGYSYPSPRQENYFKKKYPGLWQEHQRKELETKQRHAEEYRTYLERQKEKANEC